MARREVRRPEYRYLPFDVPSGCPGLRITLRYDRSAGVVDLGVFDPLGFRGWSGGAREVVLIGPRQATPGYRATGLPAGTWHVIVAVHERRAEELRYDVEIEQETVDVPAPAVAPVREPPPARRLPTAGDRTWLAGDLHAHTLHSDGTVSVDELAAIGSAHGLDFLAVTDHNTVSHHAELGAAAMRHTLILLPGQEITTADGHANAFGDIGWVDFRTPPEDWLAAVTARGGLLSINHPVDEDCPWRRDVPPATPLIEVWHSLWDRRGPEPIRWWQAQAPDAIPVGGSDWHEFGSIEVVGQPTTWVACLDGDVLAGLAAGRVAVSATRDGPVVLRIDDEVHVIDGAGMSLVDPHGAVHPIRGDRARVAALPGPYLLRSPSDVVVAMTG